MTRIILVRHGETEWNRQEVFRGRIDVPLNETGTKQAERAADALRAEGIVAVYSSPLHRALQTAMAIARPHGLMPQVHEGFTDCCFGEWEGLLKNVVKVKFADAYHTWATRPEEASIPGGETLAAVRARSQAALEEVISAHEGKTIVIATHRVITKVILSAVLGLDNSAFWRIKQDNCCVNIFSASPPRDEAAQKRQFTIELLNDTCHLREAGVLKADF